MQFILHDSFSLDLHHTHRHVSVTCLVRAAPVDVFLPLASTTLFRHDDGRGRAERQVGQGHFANLFKPDNNIPRSEPALEIDKTVDGATFCCVDYDL